MKKDSLVYVASPYYSDNPGIMRNRFELVKQACYLLLTNGYNPLSPIMIWHQVRESGVAFDGVTDPDIVRMNRKLLDKCDSLLVLCASGWKESVGITEEVRYARESKMKVVYCKFNEFIDRFCQESTYGKRSDSD